MTVALPPSRQSKADIDTMCRDTARRIFEIHPDDPITLAENAAWRLAWEQPLFSAHGGVSPQQRLILAAISLLVGALALAAPYTSFMALGWALAGFFTIVAMFRAVLLIAGLYAAWRKRGAAPASLAIRDEDLPVYTVIAPLYHEPGSVPQLITALMRLDYPALCSKRTKR